MQLRALAVSVIIAGLSTVVLTGCSKFAKVTPEEHIERAKDAQAKGDIKTSIIELKTAIQQQPNNAQARLLLGELYIKNLQGNPAEKELRKAKELGVKEESIRVLLGEALLIEEEYKKVLNEIHSTPETSLVNRATILRQHGDAMIGLGRIEEGCAQFQHAREIYASYAPAFRGLAKCSIAQHKYDAAKALLDTALKLDAQDADSWSQLGDLEAARENLPAARNAYVKAQSLDHGHVRASIGIVSLYLRSGEMDKAVAEIEAARKANPGNLLVRYNEALVSVRRGKLKEARDQLQEVLRNAPGHMPSVLLSGTVEFALGSYEQANQNLSKFLSHYPGNYFAAKVLAATDLELNQPDDALKIITNLLSAFPNDPQVLGLAGSAYNKKKDYAKATEYLERATAIEPKDAKLRAGLGYARLASGETQQAIAALESAVTLDPTQTKANVMLVMTHLRRKEYDQALAAAQSWQKDQPNNPLIYNLAGAAYLGKKDLANARKSFEQAVTVLPSFLPAAENLAKLDLLDKNPSAAYRRFENVLALEKDNVGAMIDLADVYLLAGKEQDYVSWLEKAIKAKPALLEPYRLLSAHYLKRKDNAKALAVARQAQGNNPGNPDILDFLGATQLAIGKKADALATYNSLATLASKSPLAHFRLGNVQALMQNREGARTSLKKALSLKPDYRDAQLGLVVLDTQMGDYADALAVARQMQQLDRGNPFGHGLEGDILMTQKQFAAAAKAYENALQAGGSGIFAIKLHQALSLAGQAAKAESSLLAWLRKNPAELVVRAYLGESYGKAGRYPQAVEQYQYVLGKSPSNVAVLNNLAWTYAKQKDPRALATAEKAYQLSPSSPVVLDTYGWILLEKGDDLRATQLLQEASRNAPIPRIRYHLAVALLKSGDKAGARRELEQTLQTDKRFPEESEARALLATLR